VLPAGTQVKHLQIVPDDLRRLGALVVHRRGPFSTATGSGSEAEVLRDVLRVGLLAGPRLARAALLLRQETARAVREEDEQRVRELEAVAEPLEELFLVLWRGRLSDTPWPTEPGYAEIRAAWEEQEKREEYARQAWLEAALGYAATLNESLGEGEKE
jgi:hypothetical protein